jgi:hypothetical protein
MSPGDRTTSKTVQSREGKIACCRSSILVGQRGIRVARSLLWYVALAVLMLAGGRVAAMPGEQIPAETKGGSKTFLDMTPSELSKQVPELKHLAPAESQEMLPTILERVGVSVADFFNNFSNTTCTENVVSVLDFSLHNREARYEGEFNYLALSKPAADKTHLEELRTNSKGEVSALPGAVVTTGFVALAAHFHPTYQADSHFRYLGREEVKGVSTYVVAFAQRPAVARQMGRVVLGDQIGNVFVQGVAWIDPAGFRILRLRTDILQSEVNIGLKRQSTDVKYSEVNFEQGSKSLWLPREVSVSGEWRNYSFHNHHRYSDYRLFVVQTDEKQKNP